MKEWVEVFRAGTHTDSAGNTRTWTEADLQKIAASYDPAKHEAPAVLGHPKDNHPAYAWVEAAKAEGGKLFVKFKQVVPAFGEAVKQGLWKKRSISLYPDMTLRHVGFLGAQPPAIKGLADIKFSASDNAQTFEMEFSDGPADPAPTPPPAPTDPKEDTHVTEEEAKAIKAENERLKAENAKQADTNKQFSEQLNTISTALENERKGKRTSELSAFCEKLAEEGKLTPAMQKDALDFMGALDGVGDYEFSEGGKASAVDKFQAFLSSLPKQVDFGETATKSKAGDGKKPKGEAYGDFAEVDADRLAIHEKAMALVAASKKAGGSLEYAEAIQQVIVEGE